MNPPYEPCKLCELRQEVTVDENQYTGDTIAKIEGDELLISYDSGEAWAGMKANFCPLCGRRIQPEITAWGFTKRQLEFVEQLHAKGISPEDLKEHYRDFEWVAKILRDDLDEILEQAFKNAIREEEE